MQRFLNNNLFLVFRSFTLFTGTQSAGSYYSDKIYGQNILIVLLQPHWFLNSSPLYTAYVQKLYLESHKGVYFEMSELNFICFLHMFPFCLFFWAFSWPYSHIFQVFMNIAPEHFWEARTIRQMAMTEVTQEVCGPVLSIPTLLLQMQSHSLLPVLKRTCSLVGNI